MMRRLRERLARQDGFTLVEAMFTCVLLVFVTGSAQLVLQGAFTRNESLQRRSEALQRGRVGLDRVQTLVRSQVCLSGTVTPILAASSTSMTFYADTSTAGPTTLPRKHVISVDGAGNLTDVTYLPTGAKDSMGNPIYSTTADRTEGIVGGIRASGTTPIFQFYGYPNTTPAEPTVPLNSAAAPTVTDPTKIGKVSITFRAYAGNRSPTDAQSSTLTDDVFVRSTNPNFAAPNSTAPGFTCKI